MYLSLKYFSQKKKKYFTESRWPYVFTHHTSTLSIHTSLLPWISLGVLSLSLICLIDGLIMLKANDPWALGSLPLSWEPKPQSGWQILSRHSRPETGPFFARKLLPSKAHHFPWSLKFWKKFKKFHREQTPCFSAEPSPLTVG